MADALVSGTSGSDPVQVQVLLSAPLFRSAHFARRNTPLTLRGVRTAFALLG